MVKLWGRVVRGRSHGFTLGNDICRNGRGSRRGCGSHLAYSAKLVNALAVLPGTVALPKFLSSPVRFTSRPAVALCSSSDC